MKQIRIAGVGNATADYLYDQIDIESDSFKKYQSRSPGDGGLVPGKLVLTDDFGVFVEENTELSIDEAIAEIVDGMEARSFNLGGPAAAALINAAQMLHGENATVEFYAANGSDDAGAGIRHILDQTPVEISHFVDYEDSSPYTVVLSDPRFNDGAGERTFLNNIGSSYHLLPSALDDGFFDADIRLLGGTALVPPIHEALTSLLDRCRDPHRLSIVSTVYDFPNEKKHPEACWPLGKRKESYRNMDLLVMDAEEALRLSGTDTLDAAKPIFKRRGTAAFIITCGTEDVYFYSDGSRFAAVEAKLPISRTNTTGRGDGPWDTTGCGDNFAGALLYSIACQTAEERELLDLYEACTWGVCAGDFACYYIGGTYIESYPGEKFGRIQSIHTRYEEQLGG